MRTDTLVAPEQAPPGPARPRVDARVPLAVLVAVTLLSTLANGYQYGVSSHDDQVPLIKHILDPSYLARDWFVLTNNGLNVRSFYSYLMAALTAPLGIEAAFLLVYLAGLALTVGAVYLAARALWSEPAAGLLAGLIAIYNTLGSLGESQVALQFLVPSYLGFGLILLAAYFLLRRRYAPALILIAAAGLIHPLIGPEGGLLLGGATLAAAAPAERRRLVRVAPWWLAAIGFPAALGLLIKQGNEPAVDQATVIHILAWLREPWHQLPAAWDAGVWLRFGIFAGLVAIARAQGGRVPFLDWVIVGIVGFCAVVMLGLVFPPLIAIVILQPFRMFVLFQWAGLLYLGHYCRQLLTAGGWPGRVTAVSILALLLFAYRISVPMSAAAFGAVVLCGLLLLAVRRRPPGDPLRWLPALPLAAVALALALPLGAGLIRGRFDAPGLLLLFGAICLALAVAGVAAAGRPRARGPLLAAAALAGLFAVAVLGLAWTAARPPGALGSFQASVRKQERMHLTFDDDFGRLALWARANTPRDAIFITPPYDYTFRLLAERAIVADFIAVPYHDQDVVAWRDRIFDLAGGPLPLGATYYPQLVAAYHALPTAQFRALATKYGASYAVVPHDQVLDLPVAFQDKSYTLYAVR